MQFAKSEYASITRLITNLTRSPMHLLGFLKSNLLHLARTTPQATAGRGLVITLTFGASADIDFLLGTG